MVSEIKLVIQDSDRTLEIITTEVNRLNPSCLIQSLQKIQKDVNEALTKLIADDGFYRSSMQDESEGDEDEELSENEEVTASPIKRKK